jgi:hypothetical protein
MGSASTSFAWTVGDFHVGDDGVQLHGWRYQIRHWDLQSIDAPTLSIIW